MRQLESLVRLSEALAKLECQDEVTERHVNEARRLLSKSIVRVEQPDIELDEDMTVQQDDAPRTRMDALHEMETDEVDGNTFLLVHQTSD